MAVLLGLEALTFVVAAILHTGTRIFGLGGERFTRAALPEAIIAGVLVLGAIGALRGSWRAPLLATGLSVAGVALGIATIAGGVGPRTTPDVVYHVTVMAVLAGSLVAMLRPDVRRALVRG
jgi:hypothetical protein